VHTRRRRLLLIAVPVLVAFLAISLFAARFLTTENRERDDILALVQREAAGDAPGVLARLDACDAACAAKVRSFLPRVAGAGGAPSVKIARLDSGTSYSLGTSEGWSRVVWVRGVNAVPVVQCVRVRRHGSPLTGRSVSLLRLTAPLADNEDSC
jgi:hypothetical protein